MKIEKKILISIDEADVVNGTFINNDIIGVADHCFDQYNGYCPKSLKKVVLAKCTAIGSYNFRGAAFTSVSLPVCTAIGSYNFIGAAFTSVSLPVCTAIGSDNFIGDAFTSVSLPVCTAIGSDNFRGDAFTSVSLPVCTAIGSDNFIGAAFTSVTIGKHQLQVKGVDNTCFVIEQERSSKGIKIYTGYNLLRVQNKQIDKLHCYVAEKDGYFAHGDTPKKAISDLQFKIVAEKIKKDPIHADTMITPMYYRIVTGACELGTNAWLEQNKLTGVEKMRADELVKLLEKTNAYGFERFRALLSF